MALRGGKSSYRCLMKSMRAVLRRFSSMLGYPHVGQASCRSFGQPEKKNDRIPYLSGLAAGVSVAAATSASFQVS